MRDVLADLESWWRAGETVGLGTVIGTWKSAPRQPGAGMLVGPDGTAVGSVSGGCVEGAVYELAEAVRSDRAPVLQRYGISDDDAFAVGLTCGGIIDVFVERVNRKSFPELDELTKSVRAEEPVALATVVEHPDPAVVGSHLLVWPDRVRGAVGSRRIEDAVLADARGLLASARSGVLQSGPEGQRRGEGLRV